MICFMFVVTPSYVEKKIFIHVLSNQYYFSNFFFINQFLFQMKLSQNTFEERYLAEISYIKRYYPTNILPDQKKQMEKLQSIAKELSKQTKESNFVSEQSFSIFGSVLKQLKRLKRQIQSQWKFDKSDYEAFKLKCQKLNTPTIDLLKIVNIKKKIEPAQFPLLKQVNFPILSYDNKQLVKLATLALKSIKFTQQESISTQKIEALVTKISKNYNVVSYHNFSHAFSLFLMLYQSYQISEEFKSFISSFQIFIALIAALSHDMNHTGVNNLYHIKKGTSLATKYNNQSVLENMHVSRLFKIFKQNPQLDIINSMKDALLKERAKRLLVRCILATDMSKHFSNLENFKQKRKATEDVKTKKTEVNQYLCFQKNRNEDRQILLDFMVHSCDIGNPCLEFNNYINWAALLTHQFNQQTIKQAKERLEVTQYLKYVDVPTFYKGQLTFSKNFVLPLWKQIASLWPSLKQFPKQIERNIEKLEKIEEGGQLKLN